MFPEVGKSRRGNRSVAYTTRLGDDLKQGRDVAKGSSERDSGHGVRLERSGQVGGTMGRPSRHWPRSFCATPESAERKGLHSP